MNFDRVATYYPWLETLLVGNIMQRCRTTFLPLTHHCRRALLVGEGTGNFLTELLHGNPEIQIVCVEHSASMIQQIRQRLATAEEDDAHIEFRQMDALQWTSPSQ